MPPRSARILATALGLLLAGPWTGDAPAQDRLNPGESYFKKIRGEWTVECRVPFADEEPCRLSATLVEPPVIVGLSVDSQVGLPAAVALAMVDGSFGGEAVEIGVDDFPRESAPSGQSVAVVTGRPAQRLVTQFTFGVRARFAFTVAESGQRVVTFLPLAGFGAALDAYRAQQLLRDRPGWAGSANGTEG